MRSASANADSEIAHAFARCLQKSLWPLCRLQNQHGLAVTRNSFRDGTRAGAADLFIGVEKNFYWTVVCLGFFQSAQREHHHDDAGLHVQHAGTISAPGFYAEWHSSQRAQRPDSIKVPEQHDWLLIFGAGEFDLKVIAVVSGLMNLYLPALVLKFLCQKFAHLVHGSFVVARRFDFNHALNKGEHCRHALFAERQVSSCVLSRGSVGHAGEMINVAQPGVAALHSQSRIHRLPPWLRASVVKFWI